MRVRTGGSHHQKFVVIRHRDDPSRDIAYVGGIDLCHSRRDDADHHGDPQALEMAAEYGATPPWHDIQAAITGPAVHDVETVFRERWEDPTPLSRNPVYVDPGPAARPRPQPRPAAGAGPAAPAGRRRHPRGPAAADLPGPPARARLPVRAGRRAQRRAGLHQGAEPGPPAGVHRGPVPLGPPRRQRVHRRPARQPRPAGGRRGPAVPGPRRRLAAAAAARPPARDARDDARSPPTGSRSTGSRTTPARRSTCTPRPASSTTPGRASARTTSTGGPGPTTPSCPRSWSSAGTPAYARDLRLTLAAEHLDRSVDPAAGPATRGRRR